MYHTHSNGDSEMRFFPSTLTQDIREKPWLAQVQLHVPWPWFTFFTTFCFMTERILVCALFIVGCLMLIRVSRRGIRIELHISYGYG